MATFVIPASHQPTSNLHFPSSRKPGLPIKYSDARPFSKVHTELARRREVEREEEREGWRDADRDELRHAFGGWSRFGSIWNREN